MNSESEFEIQQPGLFCLRWLFNFVTVCRSATLYHNVLIWETAEKSVSAKTLREVSGILKKIIPTKQTWMPKCVGLFMGNIWIDKKGKYLFQSVHLFYLLFFQMLVWTIRILFTVFLFCPSCQLWQASQYNKNACHLSCHLGKVANLYCKSEQLIRDSLFCA